MRVRAYHLIITTYGFWLPNDPRSSWSDFVRSWELFQFGKATTTDKRRSLARDQHDAAQRRQAKTALVRPPVRFTGRQAAAVAKGFQAYFDRSDARLYACSILPEHVHFVVQRPGYRIEQAANLLKGSATGRLAADGLHPFAKAAYRNVTLPSPWARKCWKCFLSRDDQIERAVKYVQDNPVKDGKRRQNWSFVTPLR